MNNFCDLCLRDASQCENQIACNFIPKYNLLRIAEEFNKWLDKASKELNIDKDTLEIQVLKSENPDTFKKIFGEPCGDAISREPFTDSTICEGFSCNECSFNRKDKGGCILEERVKALPSVTPQQRIGHWIDEGFYAEGHNHHAYRCSECGFHVLRYADNKPLYCEACGSKME